MHDVDSGTLFEQRALAAQSQTKRKEKYASAKNGRESVRQHLQSPAQCTILSPRCMMLLKGLTLYHARTTADMLDAI
jgi:hypothetical protein